MLLVLGLHVENSIYVSLSIRMFSLKFYPLFILTDIYVHTNTYIDIDIFICMCVYICFWIHAISSF
jgi:hypothetical protein